MGETLGFLAGVGMLALILALVFAFLRQIGKGSQGMPRRLLRCGVLSVCPGLAYIGVGALIFQAFYGNLASAAQVEIIFRGPYLQRMFYALILPSWFAPVSGAFVWAGHWLGRLLFGEYVFAGIMLAWAAVFFALTVFSVSLERLWGLAAAQDICLLLVCLPGAVFLFLPGWPCLAFLLAAIVFSFISRRMKPKDFFFPSVWYGWALAVSVCLNGAAIACSVLGKLG